MCDVSVFVMKMSMQLSLLALDIDIDAMEWGRRRGSPHALQSPLRFLIFLDSRS